MFKGFFILGSGTDVGKTYITTSLLKSFSLKEMNAVAIKPIQSGFSDKFGGENEKYKLTCNQTFASLYSFSHASSPHLAARLEDTKINYNKLIKYCKHHLKNNFCLIEGAGGIHTPIGKKRTYFDVVKELHLPIILVAQNKLGMINDVILSIDTLYEKGLDVAFIIINHTKKKKDYIHKDNILYLKNRYKNIKIISIDYDKEQNYINSSKKLIACTKYSFLRKKVDLKFDKKHIWHPYTSLKKPLKTYEVTRAKENYIYLQNKKLIDGMSSWWSVVHGYNVEKINKIASRQINKMSHVMFGGLTHKTSISLAKLLLKIVPKGLDNVFFADSGSISVEVALKMALQYHQNLKNLQKNKFFTLKGGYHGDSYAAMSVSDSENGMHYLFKGFLPEQIHLPRPTSYDKFKDDDVKIYDEYFEKYHNEVAGFILEPLVQGAGGMWFYHENYVKHIKLLCEKYDILLICDEIATGFGRSGKLFASNMANITPDIMCIGKALSGGYLSFAATLSTKKVADTISKNDRVLMHGPTFMANPLACAIAKQSVKMLLKSNWEQKVSKINTILKQNLHACSKLENVKDVRVFGAIGVVEMQSCVNVKKIQKFFVKQGVWIRPFNNLIYIMPPFSIKQQQLQKITNAIYLAILKQKY